MPTCLTYQNATNTTQPSTQSNQGAFAPRPASPGAGGDAQLSGKLSPIEPTNEGLTRAGSEAASIVSVQASSAVKGVCASGTAGECEGSVTTNGVEMNGDPSDGGKAAVEAGAQIVSSEDQQGGEGEPEGFAEWLDDPALWFR